MKHIVTQGIVLTRRDYQEADRIVTVLTPDHGKISLIAKGVRRPKSKLAGGIELFSVSELTVMPSRGQLMTLTSSRLARHYRTIAADINRTMLGYAFLKILHTATEDMADEAYFVLLLQMLEGLDSPAVDERILRLWFTARLLTISGHEPNLVTDIDASPLVQGGSYAFDADNMCFRHASQGLYSDQHIKLLRLATQQQGLAVLARISTDMACIDQSLRLAESMLRQHIRT